MEQQHRVSVALAAGLALSSTALAQPQPERLDQPPGIPATRTSPPYSGAEDGFTVRQVNVTAAGLNIVGDAANEPSIAIDPIAPNRIVIGWRQFDTISSNFRQAGRAWSQDGGRTWHNEPPLTPGTFRSDPVLESDSRGNFYYYSLPNSSPGGWRCEIFKSVDGGRNWSGPVLANGGDRAWFTIDKTAGASDGFIYGIWNPQFGCCGSGAFGRDLSGGTLPWPAPAAMISAPIWGTVAVGPDGEVYVAGRNGSSCQVVRSNTAQNPAVAPTFLQTVSVPLGGGLVSGVQSNPAGAAGQTWVDVNRGSGPRRGHVYVLTLAQVRSGDPADVVFVRSEHGGISWQPPVRVNPDPPGGIQWFPSLSVSPNGLRLDVTYLSTHESGNVHISRFYYTFSLDNGVTWSPPEALTPAFNSSVGWPQQNKLGDYFDQESDDVGVSVAMAATLNGEQDVFFIRINDWDCNRNGIGDSQDLALGVLRDCDGNGIPDECEQAAGVIVVCPCYPNCDGSTQAPLLNVADFACFLQKFAAADPYANCDGSTEPPVLNVADFGCFLQAFAAGCM